ncbi:MAG: AlpA family phage regulatory protein [Nitrospira sp.]|nr:AlpA family phage regulatory protein [Nitrospira sp.]MDE0505159.1 AlpA family phage regulatory protein [Candidatus Poribacteria bacterium]
MSTDQDVLLTRREVERRTGLSRSTLYRKMHDGTFPVPLKVSERAVRWRESDIRSYVDSRPRSYGETTK